MCLSVCVVIDLGNKFGCTVCVVCSDTCKNGALEQISSRDQLEEIQAYTSKLGIIKEVLARRHMKVAFFGRYGTPVHMCLSHTHTHTHLHDDVRVVFSEVSTLKPFFKALRFQAQKTLLSCG